jgi:hypothetical protein
MPRTTRWLLCALLTLLLTGVGGRELPGQVSQRPVLGAGGGTLTTMPCVNEFLRAITGDAGTCEPIADADLPAGLVRSLTGTANQVIASASSGAVTLSLPQSIHSGATPSFAGLSLGGDLLFSADNTHDLGAAGANRPRTGYFGTLLSAPQLQATSGSFPLILGVSASDSFFVAANAAAQLDAVWTQYTADANGLTLRLRKARGTNSSPSIVANGDVLGTLMFSGYGASSFRNPAQIQALVSGAPSGTSVPTDLVFATGTTSTTERWRITSAGHLIAGADNTYDLGAAGATRPRTGYFGTSVITPALTVSGLTANSFLYSGAGGALTTTSAPTNGQLLIGSTGAAPVLASLTGTANQITVTAGAGSITLSTPQAIATGSSPTFTGLTVSGLTTTRLVKNTSGALGSALLSDDGTNTTLTSGQLLVPNGTAGAPSLSFSAEGTMGWYRNTTTDMRLALSSADKVRVTGGAVTLDASHVLQWGSSGVSSADLVLAREAAGTLAQRNGANAQTLHLYRSYTDASNYARLALNDNQLKTELLGSGTATETTSRPLLDLAQTWNSGGVTFTGLKANITDTASAAASLLLDLQVGGVSKLSVDKTGLITANSGLIPGTTNAVDLGSSSNRHKISYLGTGVDVAQGTITSQATAWNSTATWNASGVTFTHLKTNVTNTASATASLLLDLQVGGTSQFSVRRDGLTTLNGASGLTIVNGNLTVSAGVSLVPAGGGPSAPPYSFGGATSYGLYYSGIAGGVLMAAGGADHMLWGGNTVALSSGHYLGWGSSGISTPDLKLYRDAANTFAQRNATTAQTWRIYGTWTDASNYERLSLSHTTGTGSVIAAETAGTGGDNLGITLTPAGTGSVTVSSGYFFAGTTTHSALGSPADGALIYCSDCTVANPCAASGTGAIAKRSGGVWICN